MDHDYRLVWAGEFQDHGSAAEAIAAAEQQNRNPDPIAKGPVTAVGWRDDRLLLQLDGRLKVTLVASEGRVRFTHEPSASTPARDPSWAVEVSIGDAKCVWDRTAIADDLAGRNLVETYRSGGLLFLYFSSGVILMCSPHRFEATSQPVLYWHWSQ